MPARPIRTFGEIVEMMSNAPRATADDVTITADGRRLDTPDKVRAWVAEMNVERAREDRARQEDGPDA